jgi:hypothetical protein
MAACSFVVPGATELPGFKVSKSCVLTISPTSPDEYSEMIIKFPRACSGSLYGTVLEFVVFSGGCGSLDCL